MFSLLKHPLLRQACLSGQRCTTEYFKFTHIQLFVLHVSLVFLLLWTSTRRGNNDPLANVFYGLRSNAIECADYHEVAADASMVDAALFLVLFLGPLLARRVAKTRKVDLMSRAKQWVASMIGQVDNPGHQHVVETTAH